MVGPALRGQTPATSKDRPTRRLRWPTRTPPKPSALASAPLGCRHGRPRPSRSDAGYFEGQADPPVAVADPDAPETPAPSVGAPRLPPWSAPPFEVRRRLLRRAGRPA